MRKMMEKMKEKVPKTSMTDGINPQRSHKKRAGLAMLLVLMLLKFTGTSIEEQKEG